MKEAETPAPNSSSRAAASGVGRRGRQPGAPRDDLKIYTLLSPFLVVLAALIAVRIGDWMDRREQRRHPAE